MGEGIYLVAMVSSHEDLQFYQP